MSYSGSCKEFLEEHSAEYIELIGVHCCGICHTRHGDLQEVGWVGDHYLLCCSIAKIADLVNFSEKERDKYGD